jgi:hypothetical protein
VPELRKHAEPLRTRRPEPAATSPGRPGKLGLMAAEPAPGREYFTRPAQPNHRRYEALRAYFTEELTVARAGERAGYTRSSMASLIRDFRAASCPCSPSPPGPGPRARRARTPPANA